MVVPLQLVPLVLLRGEELSGVAGHPIAVCLKIDSAPPSTKILFSKKQVLLRKWKKNARLLDLPLELQTDQSKKKRKEKKTNSKPT